MILSSLPASEGIDQEKNRQLVFSTGNSGNSPEQRWRVPKELAPIVSRVPRGPVGKLLPFMSFMVACEVEVFCGFWDKLCISARRLATHSDPLRVAETSRLKTRRCSRT